MEPSRDFTYSMIYHQAAVVMIKTSILRLQSVLHLLPCGGHVASAAGGRCVSAAKSSPDHARCGSQIQIDREEASHEE